MRTTFQIASIQQLLIHTVKWFSFETVLAHRLEELQVLDIKFLYGCAKPTIAVLYQVHFLLRRCFMQNLVLYM